MNNCKIWKVNSGEFARVEIDPSANSRFLASLIREMEIPADTSIYLRGSFLESDRLFANSDIDLVIISDHVKRDFIQALCAKLAIFERPVEILGLNQSEVKVRHTYRLLLHTRSMHIAGPRITFCPVKADLDTMQDHYYQYKPHMISANLSLNKAIRIMQLKQITRAYGILYFMHDGDAFSRDISTCLDWAIELDQGAGLKLRGYWESVDHPKTYKQDCLDRIKSDFLIESQRALKGYLKRRSVRDLPQDALAPIPILG